MPPGLSATTYKRSRRSHAARAPRAGTTPQDGTAQYVRSATGHSEASIEGGPKGLNAAKP